MPAPAQRLAQKMGISGATVRAPADTNQKNQGRRNVTQRGKSETVPGGRPLRCRFDVRGDFDLASAGAASSYQARMRGTPGGTIKQVKAPAKARIATTVLLLCRTTSIANIH
jgi:hypothetical protein